MGPEPMPAAERPSADGLWTGLRPWQAPGRCIALRVQDGRIRWMGPPEGAPPGPGPVHDGAGAILTPGLVDCHTHLVYAGQRADEFRLRLEGVRYEDIAAAGGGIRATVRATRAADEASLVDSAGARLGAWLDDGVCAIEIKSGYGLALDAERRQLRAARRLGEAHGLVVRTSFLGAHAVPPEFGSRGDDYIDQVCREMLPALAAEGLVDAVDVYCERIGFTREQTARVFDAARGLGLPVRLHAEQLSDMGGAALAARYGALSCDHLEHLSMEGVAAMRAAGTVAVLLPGAYYTLRDTRPPPVEALRAAGVPMAVASDHNPGTSPCLGLLPMLNMACTLFRMTVTEALEGVTVHAARALGLQHSHGRLAPGGIASFVLWQVEEPAELAYWFGQRPACTIVRQGRIHGERHGGP